MWADLGGPGRGGRGPPLPPAPAGGRAAPPPPPGGGGGGPPAPPHPFSSDLSGQDFAKLIMAGWVPAGLAFGISVGASHDDWRTRGTTYWGAGNVEVRSYTELVNATRHDARVQLLADVARLGADGVVVATSDLRVRERECPMRENLKDHIAEATIIGTAIARFVSRPAARPPASLAVLSLDPQRRQAARVRLGR